MLSLLNLIQKQKIKRIYSKKGEDIPSRKKDIPAIKQWYNSVYAFNKNSLRFLPAVHNNVFEFINAYFNSTNKNIGFYPKYNKRKDMSDNRIWVSNPEIKHSNEKINITVYVYNKVYNYYLKKLKNINFSWGPLVFPDESIKMKYSYLKLKVKTKKPKVTLDTLSYTITIPRRWSTLSTYFITNKKIVKNENFFLKTINWLKADMYTIMEQHQQDLYSLLYKNDKEVLVKGLKALKIERQNFLIEVFKKELLYFRYRQIILFNKFKFTNVNLTYLIEFLQNVYNKKVEFNIVTLKYYYLSSSILSQLLVSKIEKRLFRGRPLAAIDSGLMHIRPPALSKNKVQRLEKIFIDKQNVLFTNLVTTGEKDNLNEFILTNNNISQSIDGLALSNLDNKSISGVFIKVAGRLTKRFKAQRAVSKLRYKGTLRNVHSAYKGLSSTTLRGYDNINVEKSKIQSVTRIGSYGLTGWIASY